MRGLLTFVAAHLDQLGEGCPLLVRLRKLFAEPHERSFMLQVYLLKNVRLSRPLQEVKLFCTQRRHLLPSLADLPGWEVKVASRLGFNPFLSLPDYLQIEELLLRLCLQREESQLLAFLDKHKNAASTVPSLLGAVAYHLYLPNAAADLPESHKLARDWFLARLPDLLPPDNSRCIGEALLRNAAMGLHLDSESSGACLHLRSVTAHLLLAFGLRSGGNSPLAQCATDLPSGARSFLPSLPSDETSVALRGMGEAVSRYSCSCGYVYIVANCGARWSSPRVPRARTRSAAPRTAPSRSRPASTTSPVQVRPSRPSPRRATCLSPKPPSAPCTTPYGV